MKRTGLILIIFILAMVSLNARGQARIDPKGHLNVYCYDSFSSQWGPGPIIARAFTEKTGIKIEFHAPGDAITVLNQLILEKGESRADVVIGLDDSLLDRVLAAEILEPYSSLALSNVDQDLIFDSTHHLLPYDYGHFAINWDSNQRLNPPSSLEDLTGPEYADQLILIDPRTSTPGLGFLLWTVSAYGDQWVDYWQRLKPSILTIADGWSQAYALFTAGEASMVLSYGTSPVYHAEYEASERYRALAFDNDHVRQIEGMGIVSDSANRESAEAFLDFMLEAGTQEILAKTNIMLPVISKASLPDSFSMALRPKNALSLKELTKNKNVDVLIQQWIEVFSPR